MERRLGLLYVAPWVTVGGSDRNTVDWFRLVSQGACRTYLATTQESPNHLFGAAADHADEAWALPALMPGSEMPRFIADLVATRSIEVVHMMNSRLGFDLLPALKRTFPHLRTVAQLHAEEHPEGTGYPRYVASRYDPFVDAYSVISEHLRDRLVDYGADAEKVNIIGLGVDTDVFDPARVTPNRFERGDELHILFPARLAWQKDPLQVVEIARRLREAGSRAVVHVIGDGDLRPEMEQAVELHRLADRVVLHGYDLDMPGWYAATDVTLLPSRYEGIPLSIYESMAMAQPVVVADVGGISELVTPEIGYLVRERDDPDAFVRPLLELEREPSRRREMGQAARARAVKEFPVRRVAESHVALYERLRNPAVVAPPESELAAFDDWWADDTVPLDLAISTEPNRAWLAAGFASPAGAQASVRVGRIVTRSLPGTEPLTSGGAELGRAFTAPLPGMVDLQTVLPGHLAGLWASAADGPPPALSLDVDGPAWVDAPYLVPEAGPSPAAPEKRRRSVRAAFRSLRGR